ncbi:hypothetical protein JNW88_22835, partial [Micromonospora sp. ATA32]|nr:hypothetical protein [Micromonospora sp. ATA32]
MTGKDGSLAGRGGHPAGRRDPALADALTDARDLPDGEARFAELERIAGQADAIGDVRSGLDARFALIEGYLLHGERWRLLDPVRRCLDAVDRAPELLRAAEGPGDLLTPPGSPDRHAELLRRYQRYAVEALFGTPRVGLDQGRPCWTTWPGGWTARVRWSPQLRCRLAEGPGDLLTPPGSPDRHAELLRRYQRYAVEAL